MKTHLSPFTKQGLLPVMFLFLFTAGFAQQKEYKEAQIWVTAQSTNQLLANQGFKAFEPLEQPDENYPTIFVDNDVTFQTIVGFGGAFTDAAAITFGCSQRICSISTG